MSSQNNSDVPANGNPGPADQRVEEYSAPADSQTTKDLQQQVEEHEAGQPKKYGTFAGVFTPCLLTILGVIMFLREGRVVGNAGLGGAFLIILLSFAIRARPACRCQHP